MKEMKTNDVGGRDRLAGSHHSGWEIRITTRERESERARERDRLHPPNERTDIDKASQV